MYFLLGQNIDEFVSSSEQIWWNVTLQHLLNMDALQWMGAVRTRVQTADKNITSNPHHSSALK